MLKDIHFVGGVVGKIVGGTANNCINEGKVCAVGKAIGGISGSLAADGSTSNGVMSRCVNKGEIIQIDSGDVSSKGYIGGIVGYVLGNNEVSLTNCYNMGDITEKATSAGGVSGIGGAVGVIANDNTSGEISRTYSCGRITITNANATDIGGFIGSYTTTTFNLLYNSYEKSKCTGATLNTMEGINARTNSQMRSTTLLNNLNTSLSPKVWQRSASVNGGYPTLIPE